MHMLLYLFFCLFIYQHWLDPLKKIKKQVRSKRSLLNPLKCIWQNFNYLLFQIFMLFSYQNRKTLVSQFHYSSVVFHVQRKKTAWAKIWMRLLNTHLRHLRNRVLVKSDEVIKTKFMKLWNFFIWLKRAWWKMPTCQKSASYCYLGARY